MRKPILCAFLLIAFIAQWSQAADTVLLGGSLHNGDQEAGAYSIQNVANAAQSSSTEDHTTGSGTSMRIDLTAGNSFNGPWKGITTPSGNIAASVDPGDTVTNSCWVYIPASTVFNGTAVVSLQTRYTGGNSDSLGGPYVDITGLSRNTWHLVSEGTLIPAGITELQMTGGWNLETEDPPTGYSGYVYLDDFQVLRSTPAPPPGLQGHGLTTNPSGQDLDGNGLPDVWEGLYGAHDIDPNADSDGDGSSNANEAGAGTNPFDPFDALKARIESNGSDQVKVMWPILNGRPGQLETTTTPGDPGSWIDQSGTPTQALDDWQLSLSSSEAFRFFRVRSTEEDGDLDGVPDWLEELFGFSTSSSASVSEPISYDTDDNGSLDTTLTGDLAAFNEIYRRSEAGTRPTRAQAARLLLQASFGAASMSEIDDVAALGEEAWINDQIALPPTLTKPYILAIKGDFDGSNPDSSVSGYASNTSFVFGVNYPTAWARAAINGDDQLRQRVAWALSQIVVTSRAAAMLANQPEAVAHYYDILINNAFGNYEDILLEASLSPLMGHYLSHIGNRVADPLSGRFPDENYAREIMQLFTIGLWQLNMDGTQVLDTFGEPVPTYGNPAITELARVFTGTNYAAGSFGGGYRDDGFYMTTPMTVFASEHDFDPKTVVTGYDPSTFLPTTQTIPSRSATNTNARQDVEDAVNILFNHPNTPPFISRQLIQFLVTSNPTPGYVQRVATVFADNGSGVRGDLEAVVKAILLDDEARDPLQHLGTPHFGKLREPTVRAMHLSRILNMGRHSNLRWWDWGTYKDQSLQDPMNSPSVFNYFRPDFRLFGDLASNGLDSPAFGIVDSYSSISFPNHLWTICNTGFKDGSGAVLSEDLSALESMASDIPGLLDHLSLLYCAGTLGAESRASISTVLGSEGNLTERARLAAYLVLNSPEGTCLK